MANLEARVDTPAGPAPHGAGAQHLRELIEHQPSCLLRVSREGELLACNDAGLRLLGKDDLGLVLNRPFEDHVAPEHVGKWRPFAEQVWSTGAGSMELELVDDPAGRRPALLRAVAARNHPDGLESLLVSVRDLSDVRRLEAALASEQERLAAALEDRERERQWAVAAREELDAALAERERLQADLEAGIAEQHRLMSLVTHHETAGTTTSQLAAELEASRDEQRRLAALLAEHDATQAAAQQLAAELETSRDEQRRLAALLAEHDATRAAAQQLAAELEASRDEQRRLATLLAEHDATQAAAQQLAAELEASRDEQRRLAALLAEHDATQAAAQQLAAELEASRDEQRRLAALLAEHDATQAAAQQLAAELEASRAEQQQLQQQLDSQRASADEADARMRRDREHLAAIEDRLAIAAADEARLSAQLAEARQGWQQADASREAAEADRDSARRQLQQELAAARAEAADGLLQGRQALEAAQAEQQGLARLAERESAERCRLEAQVALLEATIESHRAEPPEPEVTPAHAALMVQVDGLRAELAAAVARQDRLRVLLDRADAGRRQIIAAHLARQADTERALGDAVREREETAAALADAGVLVRQWRALTLELEPVAAAGRLAMQLSGDLGALAATLADRSTNLLGFYAADAQPRPELEALRADALRAASLARQWPATQATEAPDGEGA